MVQKIKNKRKNKWLYKKFGHSYTVIDKLVLGLKASAENVNELNLSITCCICGETTTRGCKDET